MLMPFGMLNEHHEPTNPYGVQRNFVEPTDHSQHLARRGTPSFRGNTPFGLQWALGLTTGVDLSKWDFAPEFPPYATALNLIANDGAPLPQQTHQELAFADAQRTCRSTCPWSTCREYRAGRSALPASPGIAATGVPPPPAAPSVGEIPA